MARINADARVMEFFPSVQTEEDTAAFIARMQQEYEQNGYCYYAVDLLSTATFIGFIGIALKTFTAPFTPCTDIGWRLAPEYWGQGLATEGAQRCLAHGLHNLGLVSIVAMCPVVNTKSEAVMIKAGMHRQQTFAHPLLLHDDRLRTCVLYATAAHHHF